MTTNNKPQLHVSMLNMLSRCGIQFQRRYGARFDVWHEEEILPPSVALAVGISVHKGVESDLRSKLDNKTLLSTEEIKSIVSDNVKGIWEGGMMLSEEEAKAVKKTFGETTDQAVTLATLHHDELAPELNPLAIEERFVIELDGWPIDLSGTKDVREPDCLRDTKTSKRSPSQDAARSMQMAMYSLAEHNAGRGMPKKVCLDFLVKTKTSKLVTVEAVPDNSWITPLLRRIERFIEIIDAVKSGKQAFTPAQPDDWSCSRRYCGFSHDCLFFSGRD